MDDLFDRMTFEVKMLQLNKYALGVNIVEKNLGEVVRIFQWK